MIQQGRGASKVIRVGTAGRAGTTQVPGQVQYQAGTKKVPGRYQAGTRAGTRASTRQVPGQVLTRYQGRYQGTNPRYQARYQGHEPEVPRQVQGARTRARPRGTRPGPSPVPGQVPQRGTHLPQRPLLPAPASLPRPRGLGPSSRPVPSEDDAVEDVADEGEAARVVAEADAAHEGALAEGGAHGEQHNSCKRSKRQRHSQRQRHPHDVLRQVECMRMPSPLGPHAPFVHGPCALGLGTLHTGTWTSRGGPLQTRWAATAGWTEHLVLEAVVDSRSSKSLTLKPLAIVTSPMSCMEIARP